MNRARIIPRDTWTPLTSVMLVLCLASVGVRLAGAVVPEDDIIADSRLELLQRAEAGSYQSYSITLVTREGTTTLSTNKDGAQAVHTVPLEETLALWRNVIDAGLETLTDASPEIPMPDQSEFTVRYRVKDIKGGFTASGVESLPDGRYRKLIEGILNFADARVARSGR